jgi:hypothetical protein
VWQSHTKEAIQAIQSDDATASQSLSLGGYMFYLMLHSMQRKMEHTEDLDQALGLPTYNGYSYTEQQDLSRQVGQSVAIDCQLEDSKDLTLAAVMAAAWIAIQIHDKPGIDDEWNTHARAIIRAWAAGARDMSS